MVGDQFRWTGHTFYPIGRMISGRDEFESSPSSHPQDGKSGQLGRSIPQPRQTLNIGTALAQGSAARAAFRHSRQLNKQAYLSADEAHRMCTPRRC